MDSIAAKEGIGWIKQGFALFRRQPSELSMLFLLYMLLMFSLSLIPLIGQLLPLMLVPAFTMAFMQACVEIEADRKVKPSLLLTAFRSPALATLLKLGALSMRDGVLACGSTGDLATHGAVQSHFLQLLCGTPLRQGFPCLFPRVGDDRHRRTRHHQRPSQLASRQDPCHRHAADAAVGHPHPRDVLLFLSHLYRCV